MPDAEHVSEMAWVCGGRTPSRTTFTRREAGLAQHVLYPSGSVRKFVRSPGYDDLKSLRTRVDPFQTPY